jgi:hypothetical protein
MKMQTNDGTGLDMCRFVIPLVEAQLSQQHRVLEHFEESG